MPHFKNDFEELSGLPERIPQPKKKKNVLKSILCYLKDLCVCVYDYSKYFLFVKNRKSTKKYNNGNKN